MSYEFVAATARERSLEAGWETVSLAGLTLTQIFEQYQGVYLELSHFTSPHTLFLNLYAMRDELDYTTKLMTVAEWLVDNGNNSLPTQNSLPQQREQWVKYADAFVAGYDVELVNIGHSPDSPLPAGDKNDVLLTKASVNFGQMWKYFLVSVNGFFHRSVLGPSGLYVLEGGRTRRLCNQNIAGIMSFREVGSTLQIPITPQMVRPVKAGSHLSEGALVTLPVSTQGKTVLLVIGGFLHILDSTYRMISDNTIHINMADYNLADRYFHSVDKINLDSLPLERGTADPRKISVASLHSDAVIRAYLSLPQSFAIVLDTEDVYLRKHRLDNAQLPGVYQQEGPFMRLPMFGTYGAMLDYVAYQEYEKYVYNVNYVHEPNLNYRTTEWKYENAISGVSYSSNPWRIGDGYLVELGRFI